MLNIKNNIGSLPEGAYVWKKYEYDEKYFDAPVSFVIAGASGSNFLINVSSDKLDLSSVDATFFEGYTVVFMNSGNTIDCAFEPNGVVKVIVHSSGSVQNLTYSYNATSRQITIYNTNIGTDWIASPVLKSGKEAFYITNVVSDSSTAYPDGAEQGGYWYEKVKGIEPSLFGHTKASSGEVAPSSDLQTITINHNLGEIPKMIFYYTPDNLIMTNYTKLAVCNSDDTVYGYRGANAHAYSSYEYYDIGACVFEEVNETSAVLTGRNKTYKFKAGSTYYWLALA